MRKINYKGLFYSIVRDPKDGRLLSTIYDKEGRARTATTQHRMSETLDGAASYCETVIDLIIAKIRDKPTAWRLDYEQELLDTEVG
jgi:hypothetical protein